MKAALARKYGLPDVLKIEEVPKPTPGDREVLIRVRCATVNRTDCANLTAKPWIMRLSNGFSKPKRIIQGTEFAGEVEGVGDLVKEFKVGDKVFGFEDSMLGSFCEYMVISADRSILHMPEAVSFEQASASSEGAHYAYNFINKVDLKPGQKVLVNGASGGIGSAMVQLLIHFGAVVTAVCNTKNKALIGSLGPSKIIDYEKEDFTRDDEQYHYVFDAVGKSTFGKCKRLLLPGGIYISSELGPGAQNLYYSLMSAILGSMPGQRGKKVRFPYPPNIKRSLLLVKELTELDKFKPLIDRTYPLEQISEAFEYVLTGQKTGNVVITIP